MPQVLCPVLVGRDEESRRLRAALAAAAAGRGGTVFLAGEAGIGKSRLVREAVRAAGERGLTVLAGRAVAGGVPTPFRPFAEALTAAGRAGRLPASEELDALTHEAVLAGLLPPERALLAGRALAAVEAAHPGLPGAWCTLAADANWPWPRARWP